MPKQSIGTLAALLIFGFMLNITALLVTPGSSHAQMSELSDIQSDIFHLSIKSLAMDSETFANDKYIDKDQAKFFAAVSLPKPYTPADDNYPFTLVDDYLLDSDLEIEYKYKSIMCTAYPQKSYLSRNNYSYADFSNLPPQPKSFFNVIKGSDPYTGEKVTAVYMRVTDYDVTVPEIYYKMESGSIGCVYDTYIRVDSAQVWVWTRKNDTDLQKRCASVTKVNSCLPPSAVHQPKTIRILRIPFDPSCPKNELPLLEAPRSNCYYPLPLERNSAAATNWSYNYRNGNLNQGAVQSSVTRNTQSTPTTYVNPCQTCR